MTQPTHILSHVTHQTHGTWNIKGFLKRVTMPMLIAFSFINTGNAENPWKSMNKNKDLLIKTFNLVGKTCVLNPNPSKEEQIELAKNLYKIGEKSKEFCELADGKKYNKEELYNIYETKTLSAAWYKSYKEFYTKSIDFLEINCPDLNKVIQKEIKKVEISNQKCKEETPKTSLEVARTCTKEKILPNKCYSIFVKNANLKAYIKDCS